MHPEEKKGLREFLGLSTEQLARVLYCPVGEIHRQERSEEDKKKLGRAVPNQFIEDFYVACKHLKDAVASGTLSVDELQKEFLASMAHERWAILGFFLHKASLVAFEQKKKEALEAAALAEEEEEELAEEDEELDEE
jgi:signal transduction protein with GAF and PtsI domain